MAAFGELHSLHKEVTTMALRLRFSVRFLVVIVALAACALATVVHQRNARARKRSADMMEVCEYWIKDWEYGARYETDGRPELIAGHNATAAWYRATLKGIRDGTIDVNKLMVKGGFEAPNENYLLVERAKIFNRKREEKLTRKRWKPLKIRISATIGAIRATLTQSWNSALSVVPKSWWGLYFPRLSPLSCGQAEQPLGDALNFLLSHPRP
jgi:hypothetical protein